MNESVATPLGLSGWCPLNSILGSEFVQDAEAKFPHCAPALHAQRPRASSTAPDGVGQYGSPDVSAPRVLVAKIHSRQRISHLDFSFGACLRNSGSVLLPNQDPHSPAGGVVPKFPLGFLCWRQKFRLLPLLKPR